MALSVPIEHKDHTPRTDSGLSTVEVKEYVIAKSCLLPNTAPAERIDRATPDKQYITRWWHKIKFIKAWVQNYEWTHCHNAASWFLGGKRCHKCAFFNFISHSCIPFTRVIKPSYVPTHYLLRSIIKWKQIKGQRRSLRLHSDWRVIDCTINKNWVRENESLPHRKSIRPRHRV
jgi:hypothetical protein